MHTTGTLTVPGATLHYALRGTGPLLLISQSGEGDADRSVDLVNHLAADHTVLTYDRRGLSRSTCDDPAVTLAQHADDVHRLLAAVADGPVPMLGLSIGASIGLHLALTHPERLSALIAFEPVSPRLLPAADRAHHERELAELQDLYRREGLKATFPRIAATLGIDPANPDAEPDLTPQPLTPRRLANFGFFIERDFTAVIEDTLNVPALPTTTVPIIPAHGRTTPAEVFDRRCTFELAALLGVEALEFPGGHNGNTTHPRAYAERLRSLLTTTANGGTAMSRASAA